MNRLNARHDPDHENDCQEACCLNFKTEEPDYTPSIGNADPPRDRLYGHIDIAWNLSNDNSTPVDCSVRFSLDGGLTFKKCSPGEGAISLRRLPTCPHGTRHKFTWASHKDIRGRHGNVRVMILVHGKDGILLHPFEVSNLAWCDEDIETSVEETET
jgi:hypothetical protein